MTPEYSILYVQYVPISLCVQIFKAVYRQIFCRCVRLMQRVLYYSTTSNWSVCKSVYIILANTTLNTNYMQVIYKYYPTPILSYSLRSGTSSRQLISNSDRSLQMKMNVCLKVSVFIETFFDAFFFSDLTDGAATAQQSNRAEAVLLMQCCIMKLSQHQKIENH